MFQAANHKIGLILVLYLPTTSCVDGLQIFLIVEESGGLKIESTVVDVNNFKQRLVFWLSNLSCDLILE